MIAEGGCLIKRQPLLLNSGKVDNKHKEILEWIET